MSAATSPVRSVIAPTVRISAERPREAFAELRVGTASVPYLADHGFQDMIVLPGSFYVEMALSIERELTGRLPGVVRNLIFETPVILSREDSVIEVEVQERGAGCVAYAFHEAGGDSRPRQRAACLEVERDAAPDSADALAVEAMQFRAEEALGAERFYAQLRENRNQYGPRFQNIASIWRVNGHCMGKLEVPQCAGSGRHHLHPGLLDSMTQLLAPFVMEQGRTFILRSIERIEVADFDFPSTLWGCAEPVPGSAPGFRGNVRIFDATGEPRARLSGVAFSLLDRAEASSEHPGMELAVAANFTTEPLDDCLQFWAHHFGQPLRVQHAPYNQIFQQLLDPGSAFSRNRDGANAVLVALEEWAAATPRGLVSPGRETAERCFGARTRCVLPNGMEVAHLNRYETEYLYQEIFEDGCYLRHGVRLEDGDTVVDIGANIGLFSLFVMSRCPNARIYAFEPAPAVYDLLQANCAAYGKRAQALNLGVSDRPGTATFTFYEKSSVFSGFHSDESEDRDAIRAVVRNMLGRIPLAGGSVDEYVDELTADRLSRKNCECRLTSVSDVIREHRLERIDLLKIDAEKSELAIIDGIAEDDWPKINQVVLEIHDRTRESAGRIEALLVSKGFRCAVEQEKLLERSGLYNLYATRRSAAARTPSSDSLADNLQRNVADLCATLQSFMQRSAAPLVLCLCPRTPAAAADPALAAALDEAEATLAARAGAITGVRVIGSTSALQRYPLAAYYDAHAHKAGHMPYTAECYAVLATEIFRALFALKATPYKVIVLDCDNTLWKGVCGEDGPHGVEMTPAHRFLQELMVGQMKAGMLLALCSKNNEHDPLEVLDRRTDMPLKREHLVSWRINWNSKSENLKTLAAELNVGLDSFIFIDDNPIDCADVRASCPEVLTLQFPADAAAVPAFLDHVWAFDHGSATAEDSNRTRMYQEGARRTRYRSQAPSLKAFIEGLGLKIDIAPATPGELGRVSQLTFRTNQFNFTTIRRTEAEIRALLESGASCLTVRVTDRFGEYGITGVLMYEVLADRYRVDTLLLSCRVLGRGVEHAVLSMLGRRALEDGRQRVELSYAPTRKNQPVRELMASLDEAPGTEHSGSWILAAERLARLAYRPREDARIEDEPAESAAPSGAAREHIFTAAGERLQRIAETLCDIDRLMRAIESDRLGQEALPTADAPVGNAIENALAAIWRKVLGRSRLGLKENFFEAGGTSLRAVQLIAMIRKELKQTLSIVTLFECPTVAALAARLSGENPHAAPMPEAASAAVSGAEARGRQRRYNTRMQHAS